VVEKIARWRRRRPRHEAFVWRSHNYLLKMLVDWCALVTTLAAPSPPPNSPPRPRRSPPLHTPTAPRRLPGTFLGSSPRLLRRPRTLFSSVASASRRPVARRLRTSFRQTSRVRLLRPLPSRRGKPFRPRRRRRIWIYRCRCRCTRCRFTPRRSHTPACGALWRSGSRPPNGTRSTIWFACGQRRRWGACVGPSPHHLSTCFVE